MTLPKSRKCPRTLARYHQLLNRTLVDLRLTIHAGAVVPGAQLGRLRRARRLLSVELEGMEKARQSQRQSEQEQKGEDHGDRK